MSYSNCAISSIYDCSPGPPALNTSTLKSDSLICMSTSSASGKTATVAADVCTLPWVSVSGIHTCELLTHTCMSKYHYHLLKKLLFKTSTSLLEMLIISSFHFFFELTLSYILKRSAQKSEALNLRYQL